MSPRVFVIGAGRAGKSLAAALAACGAEVVGLHGRNVGAGGAASLSDQPVSSGPLPPSLYRANIVLITVRDAQLQGALEELQGALLAPAAVVLHASGSADPSGLAPLRAQGHACGTFHPLVPLSEPAHAMERLRNAWIGVDGDPPAVVAARQLAALMGAHILDIPAGAKASYHAAAVFASNFPGVLAYLARQLLARAGVPPEEASAAVVSLMHASVENLRGRDPAAALTGPVVRGDTLTVRAHIDALQGDEAALAAYLALTRTALEMLRQSGVSNAAHAEIESIIGGVSRR